MVLVRVMKIIWFLALWEVQLTVSDIPVSCDQQREAAGDQHCESPYLSASVSYSPTNRTAFLAVRGCMMHSRVKVCKVTIIKATAGMAAGCQHTTACHCFAKRHLIQTALSLICKSLQMTSVSLTVQTCTMVA